MKNFLKLVISILICFIPGAVGSIFTFQNIPTWYATLTKPTFSPPNWVFGPAWTLLYILMGISLFLIIKNYKKTSFEKLSLAAFADQLILNGLWSFLFFGLHSPFWGFVCIIILWGYIAGLIIAFYKLNRTASWLLIPYLAWVTFATVLNYYIMILN